MVNKDSCIKIINATLGYRKNRENFTVLQNISMECQKRDFIGVVGVNGSGKSTLLRSVCGLLEIISGEIYLHNEKIGDISRSDIAKKISIVLTEKISGFNLTTFDAVAAGQLPYTNMFNKLEEEHLKIINEAITVCGLDMHREKPLSELSDGLFQKTMIAKCIAQQTPVMLLDEPSAFLDYASKHELFQLMKKLCEEQNKCIIVSSHDLDLILKYCNKILLVKNSTIELIATEDARGHKIFKELSGGYL